MKGRINLIGNDWGYLPVVCEMALETGIADSFHLYRNIPSEGSPLTAAGRFLWNYVTHEFGDNDGLADAPLVFGLTFPRGKDACLRYVGEVAGLRRESFARIVHPRAYVAGSAEVGHGCLLEPGAVIRDGVTIGGNSWIGMGSVVTKDIPAGVIAYGKPAAVVRPNDKWLI